MATLTEAELKRGIIFGDKAQQEYVYMPAGEIGVASPICVFEEADKKIDISLEEAFDIIRLRSLKPVSHPLWGEYSC